MRKLALSTFLAALTLSVAACGSASNVVTPQSVAGRPTTAGSFGAADAARLNGNQPLSAAELNAVLSNPTYSPNDGG